MVMFGSVVGVTHWGIGLLTLERRNLSMRGTIAII